MNEVWKVWKYALGSFSDTKTSRYDNSVCVVRSIIFVTYLATNCFITAGVIRHWNSMKIDTQGMSAPMDPNDPNYKAPTSIENQRSNLKPATIKPRRLFTETYVKEMKILINEVLDEREHKKRLSGAYDDVKPLPASYFDTEHFKHLVTEEEPPYQDWSQ